MYICAIQLLSEGGGDVYKLIKSCLVCSPVSIILLSYWRGDIFIYIKLLVITLMDISQSFQGKFLSMQLVILLCLSQTLFLIFIFATEVLKKISGKVSLKNWSQSQLKFREKSLWKNQPASEKKEVQIDRLQSQQFQCRETNPNFMQKIGNDLKINCHNNVQLLKNWWTKRLSKTLCIFCFLSSILQQEKHNQFLKSAAEP
jgi:hypothetical protein